MATKANYDDEWESPNERRSSAFDVMEVVAQRASRNPEQEEKERQKLAQFALKVPSQPPSVVPAKRIAQQMAVPVFARPKPTPGAFAQDTSSEDFNILNVVRKRAAAEDANERSVRVILDDVTTEEWLAKSSKGTDAGSVRGNRADASSLVTPQLTRNTPVSRSTGQPGAYSGAPGENLERREKISFSALGASASARNGQPNAQPEEYDPEINLEDALNENGKEQKKAMCYLLLSGIALIIVAGVAVAFGLARREDEKQTPTQKPTANAPFLPDFTLEAILEDPSSPQARGLEWVMNHQNIDSMTESRKLQLMALATFYHSTDGENHWDSAAKFKWLNSKINECNWGGNSMDRPDCTEGGEYTKLLMRSANLKGSIPPEVSFLTKLTEVNVQGNMLSGQLPSEIGLLTELTEMDASDNDLFGFLPSELGLLSNLILDWNNLTLPTELGQLAMLTFKDCDLMDCPFDNCRCIPPKSCFVPGFVVDADAKEFSVWCVNDCYWSNGKCIVDSGHSWGGVPCHATTLCRLCSVSGCGVECESYNKECTV